MSDTHINVYFAEVAKAEQELEAAKGNLSTAKLALAEKKKEVNFEEPKAEKIDEPVEEPKTEKPTFKDDKKK